MAKKEATVTYVDGKLIGYNFSGEKEGGKELTPPNPRADNLKTEGTVNARDAKLMLDGKEAKVAEIKPGDTLSVNDDPTAAPPTNVSFFRGGKDAEVRAQSNVDHAKVKVEEAQNELKRAENLKAKTATATKATAKTKVTQTY